MAYLTVEDMHGTVEMIAFPDIYREVVSLLSMDSPVILHGSVDRSDKGLKVVIRSMDPIDTARKADISLPKTESGGYPSKASLVLTLFQNTDIGKLSELNDIFVKYSGKSCVYFKIIAPDLWETLLSTDRHIKPSREMMKEVEDLLGQGTVSLD